MKESKKGFTLFEILAVVAILAVLGVSSILTFNKVIKDTNSEKYNSLKEEIVGMAKVYIETDANLVEEIKSSGSLRVTVGELQEKKLLNWNIKNPMTKENIPSSDYVYAYKSSDNVIIYEYVPVDYDFKIYGIEFNLNTGIYTRTDDAVGMTFSDPTTNNEITSDFDRAEIYKEMVELTDSYGNKFIKIPKFYIKKTVNADNTIWKYQISKIKQDDGYYLPACFMDEDINTEIPYILVGKYNANLSNDGTKLESKSGKAPLVQKSITDFRNYAKANGNGYQLLDVHIIDILQTLFYVEFATLDSQSVMFGFANGTTVASITSVDLINKKLTMSSGTASNFRIGQMIDVATSWPARDIAKNLRITNISNDIITYELLPEISVEKVGSTSISTGHNIYNVAYLTGLTNNVVSPSGSYSDNASGKYPMKYRGIENLYGGLWQLVDGINFDSTNNKVYVARNAKNYISSVFSGSYTQIGYTIANTNNYILKMGYDANNPYIQLPIEVGTSDNSKYKDSFSKVASKEIFFYGGTWHNASDYSIAGWTIDMLPTWITNVNAGSRLVKTP